ncbi:MAG: hypothetical protein ACOZF2_11340 [Thermodesulfobacteriota bacterium]
MPDKVKSKGQRRFMGMAHAIKEGELPASHSPAAAKAARTMNPEDLKHMASESEKGLPERKRPRPRGKPGRERGPKEIKTTLRHIRKF